MNEYKKEVKYCIKTCSACPFVIYKYNKSTNKYAYYCKKEKFFIDNKVDVTKIISDICELQDC